jgi:alginate O-acetyltransferase complex protein AlgJ
LRARHAIALLGFAASLLVGAWVNVAFVASGKVPRPASFTAGEWLDGRATAAIDRAYDEALPFRDTGIELFGSLSWALFEEGRPGVVVGNEGWLFSREEYETDAGSPARTAAAVEAIVGVARLLSARGVALVVALVPPKALVSGEAVRFPLPDEPRERTERARSALLAAGIAVPDLAAALAPRTSFLTNDTHWTSAGALRAAAAVAEAADGLLDLPETRFTAEPQPATDHAGDLMRYVRAPFASPSSLPPPDTLAPILAVGDVDAEVLFGGPATAPVALVGTSYSADPRFSFEAALKIALQADVQNFAKEAGGPFQPMADYLAATAGEEPPKLVVWEIPVRYLDDYAGELAPALDGQ